MLRLRLAAPLPFTTTPSPNHPDTTEFRKMWDWNHSLWELSLEIVLHLPEHAEDGAWEGGKSSGDVAGTAQDAVEYLSLSRPPGA